jgi:2-polyprenyl-3-methyl-5-hydroxy-6-metoxy-1,4-benzoquinol methylase
MAVKYSTGLTYTDRTTKAAYVASKYASILHGSVLDVGCDQKQLLRAIGSCGRYVGVDVDAGADVVLNLDREELPFESGSFDTVVCADVLEHLDRVHAVFDRLCRVARRHVVVSLPNPVRTLMLAMLEGSQGRLKFYGLPVEEPRDRHRWFFGHEEAVEFLTERGRRNGMAVEQMDVSEKGLPPITGPAGGPIAESPNAQMGTLWCVLERTGSGLV